MDALSTVPHHAPVRVLTHIKKLDDCFGQFLVRVVCDCGACREIEPEALARLVGWKVTLHELALRMRCSRCGRSITSSSGTDLLFPCRGKRSSGRCDLRPPFARRAYLRIASCEVREPSTVRILARSACDLAAASKEPWTFALT